MTPRSSLLVWSVLCVLGSLLCPRAAAAAEPMVSAEYSVGSRVTAPQPLANSPPAIAFDGTQFLVVWATYNPRSLMATRVRPDGSVLDPAGIVIALPRGGQPVPVETPAVAFDGTRFVVAWNSNQGVFATRLERDGTVLDPEGIKMSDFSTTDLSPAIACARGLCLVVWRYQGDETSAGYLRGRRLRMDGTSPDSEELSVAGDAGFPSVAAGPGGFLVAWTAYPPEGGSDILAKLIAWGERPIPWDLPVVPVCTESSAQDSPHVSSSANEWLIVWDDSRDGAPGLYGVRVDRDGSLSDEGGLPLIPGPGSRRAAAASHDGGRWLLTWREDTGSTGAQRIRAARMEGDLTVLEPSGFDVSDTRLPMQRGAAVAAGGGNFLVTYAASEELFGRAGEFILGARVNAGGTVLDTPSRVFSWAAATQTRPAVVRGQGVDLVVWEEFRLFEGTTLFGARVEADGTREGAEIALPSAPGSRNPAVAFDGSRYLVVWEEPTPEGTTDIRGARVSAAGKLLDAVSLPISVAPGTQRKPAVAFAAGRLWVVWEDGRNNLSSYRPDIYGTRVRYTGEVVDPEGLRISLTPGTHQSPAVAPLGDDVLVVWEERSGVTSVSDIRGTRVKWDGTLEDPSGFTLSNAPGAQHTPALASSGAQVLAVWVDERPGLPAPRIHGARVQASGLTQDLAGIPIGREMHRHSAPTVSFDGQHYLVAWEDRPVFSNPDNPDLYGARVGTNGAVVDVQGVMLSRRAEGESSPVLASHEEGLSKVYYTRFVQKPGVNATRLKSRFIHTAP